jgi:hypothetical protein
MSLKCPQGSRDTASGKASEKTAWGVFCKAAAKHLQGCWAASNESTSPAKSARSGDAEEPVRNGAKCLG